MLRVRGVRVHYNNSVIEQHPGLVAVLLITSISTISVMIKHVGLVQNAYAAPYVAAIAFIGLNIGRKAGYIAAAVSSLCYNFFCVAPHFAFSLPSLDEMQAHIAMFITAVLVGQRPRETSAGDVTAYSGALPFVGATPTPKAGSMRSFWCVGEPTGRWERDAHLGAEYARIYLERRQRPGCPPLAWIVRDMIRAGRYSGIEAGFLGALLPPARTRDLGRHKDPS